jgi:urease subunit alpha
MFASFGKAAAPVSLALVSGLSIESGAVRSYGLRKQLVAVKNCRSIGKRQMKLNDALPKITVDPETYLVTADGIPLRSEPAKELPLAQRYCLF